MTLILITLIVCASSLALQFQHFKLKGLIHDQRQSSLLSDELQAKLKAMDDLKARMESLLLKQGLGR